MKRDDLIATLLRLPADDDVQIAVTINNSEFRAGISGAMRRNDGDGHPGIVIESDLTVTAKIEWEAQ